MFRGSQLSENAPSSHTSSASFTALLVSFHLLFWPLRCSSLIRLWVRCILLCHLQVMISPCMSLEALLAFWHLQKETCSPWSCSLLDPSLFLPHTPFLDCFCWGAHLKGAHPDSAITPSWFSAGNNKQSAHILL